MWFLLWSTLLAANLPSDPQTCEPGFLDRPRPVTVSTMPEVKDVERALNIIKDEYKRVTAARSGAMTRLYVAIDEKGTVRKAVLTQSSGLAAMDSAAMRAMKKFAFAAATRNGAPVCYWIELPVVAP